MDDFFRFPHTPHLAWLASGEPRGDKVLYPSEADEFLSSQIIVEEKLDGANLGLSLGADGSIHVQNRGQYLRAPYLGQFTRLPAWLAEHDGEDLRSSLDSGLILFGEWCAARHSLDYDHLSDWFLLFDVYDRLAQKFWSTPRRNALAAFLGLQTVPLLLVGRVCLAQLKDLLFSEKSRYRQGPLEGFIVRRESPDWCEARAKLVRADFTQTISEHWSRRPLKWNRVELLHTLERQPN